MTLSEMLAFAAKTRATEVTLQAGEPVQIVIDGKARTIFASKLNAQEFDAQIVQRLGAFERQDLKTKGRCEWTFEEKGVGKVVAEVTPGKAKFTLPALPPLPAAEPAAPSPGISKRWMFIIMAVGVLYILATYAWILFK
jgi:hypothetical protein